MIESVTLMILALNVVIVNLTALLAAVTALYWCYVQARQIRGTNHAMHEHLKVCPANHKPPEMPPAPGPVIPRPATGHQPPERV